MLDDYKLRAHELTKTFGRRTVVNSVSLIVSPGQIVGLLGPNGAGKTTIFYMIAGLIAPTQGSVYVNDREVTSCTMSQRAHMGLTYMAQESSVFRKLTVRENILVALETVKTKSMTSAMLLKESNRLMDEFGLTSLKDQCAYTLSGGERRRVEIARAIATRPHFLLLDEPFAGIDPIAVAAITEIIRYLAKKGIGILITDHNVREAVDLADYFYIIYRGRVFISGNREKIVTSDQVKKFYLGEMFGR